MSETTERLRKQAAYYQENGPSLALAVELEKAAALIEAAEILASALRRLGESIEDSELKEDPWYI